MKKLLVIIALCLPALLVAQDWENVAFKNGVVNEIGFHGNNVYVSGKSSDGIGTFVSKNNGLSFLISYGEGLSYDFMEFDNKMFRGWNWLNITSDTGKTWKKYSLYSTAGTPEILALAKIDSFVFAGSYTIQRETNPENNYYTDNHWPNLLDTALWGAVTKMIVWNDTLFAAQNNSRILFSPDKGESWDSLFSRVNNKFRNHTLSTFTINPNYIFIGCYNDLFGIFRTSNFGKTWEIVGKGIVNDTVYCMLSDGPNIIAGTQNGVFFSTDNGDSWFPRNYGLDNLFIRSLELHNDEIWMGCNDGLYKMKKDKMFTSVKKSIDIESTTISPNPARDYIEISGVVGEVKLYDVLGIEHPATAWHPSTEGNVRIDVSSLSPGVYFVSVGGKMYKFVKM